MKEEIIENRKTDKNPYSYNGDVLNLPSDLPSSNEDGLATESTEGQSIIEKTPHNKKVHN